MNPKPPWFWVIWDQVYYTRQATYSRAQLVELDSTQPVGVHVASQPPVELATQPVVHVELTVALAQLVAFQANPLGCRGGTPGQVLTIAGVVQ